MASASLWWEQGVAAAVQRVVAEHKMLVVCVGADKEDAAIEASEREELVSVSQRLEHVLEEHQHALRLAERAIVLRLALHSADWQLFRSFVSYATRPCIVAVSGSQVQAFLVATLSDDQIVAELQRCLSAMRPGETARDSGQQESSQDSTEQTQGPPVAAAEHRTEHTSQMSPHREPSVPAAAAAPSAPADASAITRTEHMRAVNADRQRQIAEKKRIQALISSDRREREASVSSAKAVGSSQPKAKDSNECALSIRQLDGRSLRFTLAASCTLQDVYIYLDQAAYTLFQQYPRRTFDVTQEPMTLKSLDLCPSAALLMRAVETRVSNAYASTRRGGSAAALLGWVFTAPQRLLARVLYGSWQLIYGWLTLIQASFAPNTESAPPANAFETAEAPYADSPPPGEGQVPRPDSPMLFNGGGSSATHQEPPPPRSPSPPTDPSSKDLLISQEQRTAPTAIERPPAPATHKRSYTSGGTSPQACPNMAAEVPEYGVAEAQDRPVDLSQPAVRPQPPSTQSWIRPDYAGDSWGSSGSEEEDAEPEPGAFAPPDRPVTSRPASPAPTFTFVNRSRPASPALRSASPALGMRPASPAPGAPAASAALSQASPAFARVARPESPLRVRQGDEQHAFPHGRVPPGDRLQGPASFPQMQPLPPLRPESNRGHAAPAATRSLDPAASFRPAAAATLPQSPTAASRMSALPQLDTSPPKTYASRKTDEAEIDDSPSVYTPSTAAPSAAVVDTPTERSGGIPPLPPVPETPQDHASPSAPNRTKSMNMAVLNWADRKRALKAQLKQEKLERANAALAEVSAEDTGSEGASRPATPRDTPRETLRETPKQTPGRIASWANDDRAENEDNELHMDQPGASADHRSVADTSTRQTGPESHMPGASEELDEPSAEDDSPRDPSRVRTVEAQRPESAEPNNESKVRSSVTQLPETKEPELLPEKEGSSLVSAEHLGEGTPSSIRNAQSQPAVIEQTEAPNLRPETPPKSAIPSAVGVTEGPDATFGAEAINARSSEEMSSIKGPYEKPQFSKSVLEQELPSPPRAAGEGEKALSETELAPSESVDQGQGDKEAPMSPRQSLLENETVLEQVRLMKNERISLSELKKMRRADVLQTQQPQTNKSLPWLPEIKNKIDSRISMGFLTRPYDLDDDFQVPLPADAATKIETQRKDGGLEAQPEMSEQDTAEDQELPISSTNQETASANEARGMEGVRSASGDTSGELESLPDPTAQPDYDEEDAEYEEGADDAYHGGAEDVYDDQVEDTYDNDAYDDDSYDKQTDQVDDTYDSRDDYEYGDTQIGEDYEEKSVAPDAQENLRRVNDLEDVELPAKNRRRFAIIPNGATDGSITETDDAAGTSKHTRYSSAELADEIMRKLSAQPDDDAESRDLDFDDVDAVEHESEEAHSETQVRQSTRSTLDFTRFKSAIDAHEESDSSMTSSDMASRMPTDDRSTIDNVSLAEWGTKGERGEQSGREDEKQREPTLHEQGSEEPEAAEYLDKEDHSSDHGSECYYDASEPSSAVMDSLVPNQALPHYLDFVDIYGLSSSRERIAAYYDRLQVMESQPKKIDQWLKSIASRRGCLQRDGSIDLDKLRGSLSGLSSHDGAGSGTTGLHPRIDFRSISTSRIGDKSKEAARGFYKSLKKGFKSEVMRSESSAGTTDRAHATVSPATAASSRSSDPRRASRGPSGFLNMLRQQDPRSERRKSSITSLGSRQASGMSEDSSAATPSQMARTRSRSSSKGNSRPVIPKIPQREHEVESYFNVTSDMGLSKFAQPKAWPPYRAPSSREPVASATAMAHSEAELQGKIDRISQVLPELSRDEIIRYIESAQGDEMRAIGAAVLASR